MKFKKLIKESCADERLHTLDESIEESVSDMNRRCEKCNTLLNDMGTCPRCDDGEEERDDDELDESCEKYTVKKYGARWFGVVNTEGSFVKNEDGKPLLFKSDADAEQYVSDMCKTVTEEMSAREKLKAAYPELNFDQNVTEECVTEELSNKEKLQRKYSELNFEKPSIQEGTDDTTEALSIRQKLKAAYPELDFDQPMKETLENDTEYDTFDYDDDYEMDDVEEDRVHAALYGGDRMYCDCGAKLVMDEWGGYCPRCNPPDPEAVDETDERFDDLDDSVDE